MAERLRRPTMNDVARVSGVSLKSVSRVINDEVGASPETRERALAAAAKSATGARTPRMPAPLRWPGDRAVLEDISNPFAAVLNRSVERVAGEQGSLVSAVSTNADPDREEYLVHRLLARAVDALGDHVLPPRPRLPAAGDRARAPGDLRGPAAATAAAPTVRVATARPRIDATVHLIAHGHHRVAFLGDRPLLYTADERQRGYTRAMRQAGPPSTPICSGVARPTAAGGRRGRRCSSWPTRRGGVRRQQHDRRRRPGRRARPQRAAEDRRGRVRRHGSGRRGRSAADGDRPGPRDHGRVAAEEAFGGSGGHRPGPGGPV